METSLAADPREKRIVAVSIIFTVFSFTFTALRFISRYTVGKKVSLDDWLILLAFVSPFFLPIWHFLTFQLLSVPMAASLCLGMYTAADGDSKRSR